MTRRQMLLSTAATAVAPKPAPLTGIQAAIPAFTLAVLNATKVALDRATARDFSATVILQFQDGHCGIRTESRKEPRSGKSPEEYRTKARLVLPGAKPK